MTAAQKAQDAAKKMTDAELAAAVIRIRGNSKRGPRRMLTEGELLALSAVLAEQEVRRG